MNDSSSKTSIIGNPMALAAPSLLVKINTDAISIFKQKPIQSTARQHSGHNKMASKNTELVRKSILVVLFCFSLASGQLRVERFAESMLNESQDSSLLASKFQLMEHRNATNDDSHEVCPPWTMYSNRTRSCKCLAEPLGGVVRCNSVTKQAAVLFCYCMTYSNSSRAVVAGHCLLACANPKTYHTIRTNDSLQINEEVCGPYNRRGQLCGQCLPDHAPAVYSYSLKCVPCRAEYFYRNLLKYLAISFIPLTVFYMVVILFRVAVTSGPMVAYVLLSQMVGSPILIRLLSQPRYSTTAHLGVVEKFGITTYSIWNLEVMRIIMPEFCLHPRMTTLDMLVLDYLIGIYPMVLVLLTYLAVSLHDRSALVVRFWAPFYTCFSCIRKEWNIRGSLVQGFATFTVLSYVKILNVSFDILTPVYVTTVNGTKSLFLYYAGNVAFFSKEHLLYACLAIVAFGLLNLLPVILLLLYPTRKFRRLLELLKLHTQLTYSFMDAFQGCYKYRPLDCRYFAGLYLLLRIIQLICFSIVKDPSYLGFTGFLLLITGMLVVYIKPYKNDTHNKIDTFFLMLFSGGHFIYLFYTYKSVLEIPSNETTLMLVSVVFAGVVLFSLPLYGLGFFIQHALPNTTKDKILQYFSKLRSRAQQPTGLEEDAQYESLPHRMENLNEYTSLIH